MRFASFRITVRRASVGSCLAVAGLTWSGAGRSESVEVARLHAITPMEYGRVGWSTAIDGDVAVAGTNHGDDAVGSAHVFRRSGDTWSNDATLSPWDEPGDQYFGRDVAISGDLVVVGSPLDDSVGTNFGCAYVFRWDGDGWSPEAKLVSPAGRRNEEFGNAVAASGNTIFVGAAAELDDFGRVYVFEYDGTDWTPTATLTPSDGTVRDRFGSAIDVDGDAVVIGAARDDGDDILLDRAYVFRHDGAAWTEEAKLLASDGVPYVWFGGSVAISGDRVVVGALTEVDGRRRTWFGSAYVYEFDGSDWAQQVKLASPNPTPEARFGVSVSVAGDALLVGALEVPGTTDPPKTGVAYLYREGASGWYHAETLAPSQAHDSNQFGYSLAISGGSAIVGAPYDQPIHSSEGSAFFFELVDGGETGCGDRDLDRLCDGADNCIDWTNPDQVDGDGDGAGDVCDNCPLLANGPITFAPELVLGFPGTAQCDTDGDGVGNACDGDFDDDGTVSALDAESMKAALRAFFPTPPGHHDMSCDGFVTPIDARLFLPTLD